MMHKRRTQGIEMIVGPMFSGKTTELLRRCKQAARAGKRCQLFKPQLDTRYATDRVVTHNGQSASCCAVAGPKDILECFVVETDVVAIDEAQLFDNAAELGEVVRSLAGLGKRVIVAGLDTDKWREPFAWVSQLGGCVQRTQLTARCAVCGKPARFTTCLLDRRHFPSDRIDIGGADKYEPRCVQCFDVEKQRNSRTSPFTSVKVA